MKTNCNLDFFKLKVNFIAFYNILSTFNNCLFIYIVAKVLYVNILPFFSKLVFFMFFSRIFGVFWFGFNNWDCNYFCFFLTFSSFFIIQRFKIFFFSFTTLHQHIWISSTKKLNLFLRFFRNIFFIHILPYRWTCALYLCTCLEHSCSNIICADPTKTAFSK